MHICLIYFNVSVFSRQPCKILEVTPPHSNGTANGHVKHRIEGDSIVISDSDEEPTVTSPKTPSSGSVFRTAFLLNASYVYP